MAQKGPSTFKLLTQAPWWVSIIISAITYIGLGHVLPEVETGNPMIDIVLKGFSHSAPFFAGVFLVAAPFAFFNARRKRRLLDEQKDLDSIKELSWKEFEELVAEAYRRQGYRVIENDLGPDGGIDVTLMKGNDCVIVQCKQWRSRSVGVSVVREIYGVLTAHSASHAIIICCGDFTRDAIVFAEGKPIQLINAAELLDLVKDGQPKNEGATSAQTAFVGAESTDPTCPKCGSDLVKRTAKRGANAGNTFWGCSSFPKCRHIDNVASL
jgi:restriction system protein